MALTSRPVAWRERIAASRPAPGPRTNTSIDRIPCSSAFLAVASAVCCAANGVDLRLPLKPWAPADPHAMTLPSMSLIEMIVLLNVDWMWACPLTTFLRSRRRVRTTFFVLPICLLRRGGHYLPALTFFLPATARLGPRRLRALVRVR